MSKNYLNKVKSSFSLSESDLLRLKKAICMILFDLAGSCEKHSIPYYLAFGTLLGAVRHSGFIPWDDDVDVFVPSERMEDLINAMKADYGDKYWFSGLWPVRPLDPVGQVKVMLSGTRLVELQNTNYPVQRGIGIDVFPLIQVSKFLLGRFFDSKREHFLLHAISLKGEFLYPPSLLLSSENKKVRRYYRFRRFLGFFLFPFSISSLMSWYRSFILNNHNHSSLYVPLDSFFGNNVRNPLTQSDIQPLFLPFEGRKLSCFSNYKKELNVWYGKDYMTPTPPSEREQHILAKIDFGKF